MNYKPFSETFVGGQEKEMNNEGSPTKCNALQQLTIVVWVNTFYIISKQGQSREQETMQISLAYFFFSFARIVLLLDYFVNVN